MPRHILAALRTQKAEILAKLAAPGHRYRPLPVDYELASLYGTEGSKREFLGAVELVAEFSGNPWPIAAALEDLCQWWDVQDLRELEPVDWIVSAAHADKVRREQYER